MPKETKSPALATCFCIRCLRARDEHMLMGDHKVPYEASHMVCCGICGCKRCPHSDDHDNTCTNSNEPGQLGSRYGIMPPTTATHETHTMTQKSTQPEALDPATALEIAESWCANPKVRPQPAQVRAVASSLVAEVRRLKSTAPLEVADQPEVPAAPDNSMLEGLDYAQLEFMSHIVGLERKQVADYLRRKVAVMVVLNDEVQEAPSFALDVVEAPGYWLNCFGTAELATAAANALGLPIVLARNSWAKT